MKMVVGGAYEGKTDYARWQFGLSEGDIADGLECTQRELLSTRRGADKIINEVFSEMIAIGLVKIDL